MSELNIVVNFSGGAELLFGGKKNVPLQLAAGGEWTLKKLIAFLRDNHLTERPELFVYEDSIRPGILVLVNDTDWELLGDKDYLLKEGDNVVFVSTLHGG